MSAWSEVDAFRDHHRRLVVAGERAAEETFRRTRAEILAAKRYQNLIHRFRELPEHLAKACVDEARAGRPVPETLEGEWRLPATSFAAQVAQDWLEVQGWGAGAAAVWHPMCPADRAMVGALSNVRMPPASQAKRFRRHLLEQASRDLPVITYPQGVKLRELVHTFRRQIRPQLLPDYARFLLREKGSR